MFSRKQQCIFLGPTSNGCKPSADIDCYEPASQGAIWHAVNMGYRRILLVDGMFGSVPSVWHKEILFALYNGVEVVGSSSMGALRVAELHEYGMKGIGTIQRLYRKGLFERDDLVAVLHGNAHLNFDPLTYAICSIVLSARKSVRSGIIPKDVGIKLCEIALGQNYRKLTRKFINMYLGEYVDPFWKYYRCQKHEDYLSLLRYAQTPIQRPPLAFEGPWEKIATRKWVQQFEAMKHEVPEPRLWASSPA